MTTLPFILFTGGGSAGHVTPNLALISHFQNLGWKVAYAGSADGIEKILIEKINIPFYAISSGKLRRYLSWKNFTDPFRVIAGLLQAFLLCRRLKPNVVFSKGGFVAFPIVFGAWLNRIPVIAHESDFTPGLANRMSFPFVKKICVTFAEGKRYFKDSHKVVVTGTPLRPGLQDGVQSNGMAFCGFTEKKPVLLIMGGGLGSHVINRAVRDALAQLHPLFNIIHICGKGKCDAEYAEIPGYRQFEYIHEELADLFACSDYIVSRAGANALYEFIVLRKPHLLIPLSAKASRGDQLKNAEYLSSRGISLVLQEESLTPQTLVSKLHQLMNERAKVLAAMDAYEVPDTVPLIANLIQHSITLTAKPPCEVSL